MQPFVSILIPCYNAGPWIAQCIQSALDQTYPRKEVVVVDDGSQDNSLDVIRSFGDRIRFETGPNRGGNVARNRLMQLSKGEWLEFLDADDFLLPQKIEKQIALLRDRPDVETIYSAALQKTGDSAVEPDAAILDEDLYANYFRWDYFTTTVLLLKKSAVMDVGGWKEDQEVCQEHELVLRLILAGTRFVLAPEALGVIRIQCTQSVSRRSPLKTLTQKMALSDRLEAHLLSINEMTEVRRVALAQARFLAARAAYSWDRDLARSLCAKALASDPFIPPATANRYYIIILRAFGFDTAERLATIQRTLLGPKPNAALPNAPSPNASSLFHKAASGLNSSVGRLCLQLFPESRSLIVLAFHAVVGDPEESQNKSLNPRYVVRLDEFEECVVYYLSRGYQAVSPLDILRGLPPNGRYVMFTFDDGYANNLQVLPVLERHRVPAIFALATDYILQQKPFWWDVLFQQRGARGDNRLEIDTAVDELIQGAPSMIEERLAERFGEGILNSCDELSRPMRPAEVKELAKSPLVFWANHTARHECLPNCNLDEIRCTIGQAQAALQELTGVRPISMVYPYGKHNGAIRAICRDLGLQLGFTMASHKQSLKLNCNSDEAMAIPRFAIYHDRGVAAQCLETRIDWKPSWLLRGKPAKR